MRTIKLTEKKYKFTTYDQNGEEVDNYTTEQYSAKDARSYAQKIVANSRCNEMRHGRITLVK